MIMKRISRLGLVLIAVLGTSKMMVSCNEQKQELSNDVQEMREENAADDRMEEMTKNLREEREQFIVQAREKIEANKRDIESLRTVAKSKAGEAKDKYNKAIEDLRAENDKLEAEIETNKEARDEKWQHFKEEFNSDMDRLGESIADLFKDNK